MSQNLSQREHLLVEMWGENKTQREIANALGVSLGVVSGLAMRLKARGVIRHKTKSQTVEACLRRATEPTIKVVAAIIPADEAEVLPVIEPPAPPILELPLETVADADRVGIDIMRLTPETCRWVLPRKSRTTGLAMYCGDTAYHRSFCVHHAAIAFRIPDDWKVSSTPYRRLQAVITTR